MNSATDVWSSVLQILEKELTPTAISTWFDSCSAVGIKDDTFILCVPSDFKRDIISARYANIIKSSLEEIFSCKFDLTILTDSERNNYIENESGKSKSSTAFDSSQFTFNRFIVGASNRFAHAAATAVAQNPASAYNPLFVYGDSGLGKTHLLYAIGHAIKNNHPDYRIVYVKGDNFTNELIEAIQNGKNIEFREKYRYADLLLVDDIQFIAGRVQTQEEFFHTFNTLYEAGRQIVLTSDRPPKEIIRLEDRLKSRFEWGLLADIQPPDFETRVAIIKNKAQQLGVVLTDKYSHYIADKLTSNIRQLEGTVKRITALRDLENREIDIELVERSIKDIIKDEKEFSPENIIEKTAAYYGINPEDVTGRSRSKNTALTRQISMYLIRKLTNMPLSDIGKYFGNKDHSTVLHSVNKIEGNIADSPELADIIRDITSNITNKS